MIGITLVQLMLTFNEFHTFCWCFHCWFWTNKFWLGLRTSMIKGINSKNFNLSRLITRSRTFLLILILLELKIGVKISRTFSFENTQTFFTYLSDCFMLVFTTLELNLEKSKPFEKLQTFFHNLTLTFSIATTLSVLNIFKIS